MYIATFQYWVPIIKTICLPKRRHCSVLHWPAMTILNRIAGYWIATAMNILNGKSKSKFNNHSNRA